MGERHKKLRSALDIYHRAIFFIASAHFQIKSNEDMTAPDSQEFKELESLEVKGYEHAKHIRKEILHEVSFYSGLPIVHVLTEAFCTGACQGDQVDARDRGECDFTKLRCNSRV